MRVLLSILAILVLLPKVPTARSLLSNAGCPGHYHCRMKCNADEYAVRYCADWTICCKAKKKEIKKKKKW
ncbi:beta-defensin 43-like [Cynocephalus volans]|uniref:beta-defensin 43-like n=1 Tax=Cynocephalus volans TaxID=110931 RepID=UPI002FC91889